MKCVHTLRTGRHKRQADITLLFQYTCTRFLQDAERTRTGHTAYQCTSTCDGGPTDILIMFIRWHPLNVLNMSKTKPENRAQFESPIYFVSLNWHKENYFCNMWVRTFSNSSKSLISRINEVKQVMSKQHCLNIFVASA